MLPLQADKRIDTLVDVDRQTKSTANSIIHYNEGQQLEEASNNCMK